MKETVLKTGRLTESDTIYNADRNFYDVYAEDCEKVTNPWIVNPFNMTLTDFNSALYAENLKNAVIDFNGATLHLNGLLQPVSLYKCENVKLCNVNIEYDRGIFSEAEVLEVTENYARVHFSEEFPCRAEDGRLIPYGRFWEDDHLFERQMFFQFFDAETHDGCGISLGIVGPELPEGQDMCFNPTRYIAEQEGSDIIFRPANPTDKMGNVWKEGTVLVIEHGGRFFSGVILQSCKNIALENVRLINTNAMGILPLHCENIYIRGLRLTGDEKSQGIITNSADAIHAIGNSGDFLIDDSVLENMIDDAMNVHGQFQKTVSCVGNILTVKITSHGITQYSNLTDEGDEIAIYEGNTMVCRSTHKVLQRTVIDPFTAELTLDSAPGEINEGDLVENLTGNCKLTLRRCRFGKSNTHLRFQTRGRVLVEDCVTELPFLFTGDATFWYESGPCCDAAIRNTYFVKPEAIIEACPDVCACEKEPYYHKHITVENCLFVNETPLQMSCTDDIKFIANRHALGKKMKIRLTNCGSIEAQNCEIERLEKKQ